MSKNLNQVDIGGPERGSCLETAFTSPAHHRSLPRCAGVRTSSGNAASAGHDNRAGIGGSPISDKRSYPPVVLMGSNYTSAFRPPDGDSSSAFHPSESGAGWLQRCQQQAVPG